MDIVISKILDDLRLLINKKINISVLSQRIYYYLQEYYHDNMEICYNKANMIEKLLNNLKDKNELDKLTIKEIFQLINKILIEK